MGGVTYDFRMFYGFVVDLDQFVVDRVDRETGNCNKWDYAELRRNTDDQFCSDCGTERPSDLDRPLGLITSELEEVPDDNAMMQLCYEVQNHFDFDQGQVGSYDWDTDYDIARHMSYAHEPRLIGESEKFPSVRLRKLTKSQGVEFDDQYGYYGTPAYFGVTIDKRRTFNLGRSGEIIQECNLDKSEMLEATSSVHKFFEGTNCEPKLQTCVTR